MQRSILITGAIAVPILFCSGLLVGRQFPAHRFVRIEGSPYLYDSATGKTCNFLKNPKETSNLIDQGMGSPAAKYHDYPPSCAP